MQKYPSLIKRPLLLIDGKPMMVGFVASRYEELLTR